MERGLLVDERQAEAAPWCGWVRQAREPFPDTVQVVSVALSVMETMIVGQLVTRIRVS